MPDLTAPSDKLDLDDLLIAEFNYIAQTAFQANEDRARVSNYYLVTVVASIGAILSANLEKQEPLGVYVGFATLFTALSIIGYLTVLQLAKLRVSWEDSAYAMDKIKAYYKKCNKDIAQALFWTRDTIPPAQNPDTIALLLARSVIYVSFATAITAVVYAGYAIEYALKLGWSDSKIVLFGILGLIIAWSLVKRSHARYNGLINKGMDNLKKRLDEHATKYPNPNPT